MGNVVFRNPRDLFLHLRNGTAVTLDTSPNALAPDSDAPS
jgi:hypothetical protein